MNVLNNLWDYLKGKKTYIVAGAIVVNSVSGFIAAGDWSLLAVIGYLLNNPTLDVAILAAAVRHGIASK